MSIAPDIQDFSSLDQKFSIPTLVKYFPAIRIVADLQNVTPYNYSIQNLHYTIQGVSDLPCHAFFLQL